MVYAPYIGTKRGTKKTMRRRLCESQNHRCAYCGAHVECGWCNSDEITATFEHVRPKSHGGPDHTNNVVIACPACNEIAGNAHTIEQKLMKILKAGRVKICG